MSDRERGSAWIGLCCAAVQAVVAGHYLRITWSVDVPVPIAWWAVAVVAGVVGVPLILVSFGREAQRLAALPWRPLLRTWIVPVLVAHVLWLGACVLLLRRLDDGLAGVPLDSGRDLLAMLVNPPPAFALLYALALFPALAKLTRAVPVLLVIAGWCALAVVVGVAALLVFLVVGLRLSSEPPSRTGLAGRVAVAVIGLAMLGVQPLPDRLAMVIAGLAALPLCLAVAAPAGARLPGTFRWAVLAGYLLLVPAVAVTNKVVLARLSAMPSPAQLALAVVEPLVWTAGIVVAATAVPAAGRRVAAVLGGGAPRCDVE